MFSPRTASPRSHAHLHVTRIHTMHIHATRTRSSSLITLLATRESFDCADDERHGRTYARMTDTAAASVVRVRPATSRPVPSFVPYRCPTELG
jgi:hypothetical protein